MSAACAQAGIRAEVCSDIFTAIDKGKTRVFSCVIADWADQPEASFLLKRARESAANRETIAVAIVDHDPTQSELRDSRLDFLVYRPISPQDAHAVLMKACEKMQPMNAEDARESFEEVHASSKEASNASAPGNVPEPAAEQPADSPQAYADDYQDENTFAAEVLPAGGQSIAFRGVLAAVLVLAAAFFLWSSREVIQYLSETPEGSFQVLRESVRAFFDIDKTGTSPLGPAAVDAQQDAYFSRDANNRQSSNLAVAATESTLADERLPLPKAYDFPLPQPVVEHWVVPPVHVERNAIPESVANSAPIERPVVVTVNPAQMMPVSAPETQAQPNVQQASEPVVLSEEAARAALIHIVNPVYPPEALAQKLHGPVVLQAVVGRDGSVQDLKIVRGYFVLGKAAIAAVRQWRFQPYSLNGRSAATQTLITINFNYPPS